MKIALIDPPFYRFMGFYNRYYPYGITLLGTILKQAGHNVLVYDADANDRVTAVDCSRFTDSYDVYLQSLKTVNHPIWEEIRRTLADFQPNIIGITVWTTFAASALVVAQIGKEVCPDAMMVMGGAHASVRSHELMKVCPELDYVLPGPADVSMLNFVNTLAAGQDPASLGCLVHRTEKGVIGNPGIASSDVNNPIYPDRSLLKNVNRYSAEDMGLILTSQGCPFRCTYCATPSKKVQYRDIDNILAEIEDTRRKYGTVFFTFKDDSFTVNKNRAEEFCERLIRERIKITWECHTRVDLVDQPLLELMFKAGCRIIKVGVESGSQRILDKMKKGITIEQIKKAGKLFEKAGIYWTGYFMMGVPGETAEDMEMTLALVREIKPDFASLCVYEPFPGTEMFKESLRLGLVSDDMTRNMFFNFKPNHYYKTDQHRQLDTMEPDEFQAAERRLKSEFHRHNANIFRILKRARARSLMYLQSPRNLAQDVWRYLQWK